MGERRTRDCKTGSLIYRRGNATNRLTKNCQLFAQIQAESIDSVAQWSLKTIRQSLKQKKTHL